VTEFVVRARACGLEFVVGACGIEPEDAGYACRNDPHRALAVLEAEPRTKYREAAGDRGPFRVAHRQVVERPMAGVGQGLAR